MNVAGDLDVELQESFSVTISDAKFNGVIDAAKVTISDARGIGTINDDDAATISIDDVTVNEGDGGAANFVFTISSDVAASRDLSVTVNTADLSGADAGTDYLPITNLNAIIAAGSTSTTVSVTVVGDQLVEFNETFAVDITDARFDGATDPARVTIGDARGVGTIRNDDVTSISITDVSVVEGDLGATDFVFTISSTLTASENIDLTVDTANLLDAIGGIDYTPIVGQIVTIAAGTNATTVTVSGMTDSIVEIDETFAVNLTDARFNGSLDAARVTIADATGVGAILNDDAASLSINDVAIAEGDSGTTTFTFTVSSSAAASRAIDFTVDTATALAAIAGTDYTAVVGQSGTIAIGATSTTVTVDVIGDNLVEIDETFSVMLSDALFGGAVDLSRAALADATGTGTILNDDVASLTIDNVSMVEVDTGSTTSYSFTITSSALASEDIEVAVNTADLLDAVGGTDYTAIVGGTALISAGATSTTVTVTVIGDQLVELDETFEVRLSAGEFNGAVDTSRVVFADSVGVGTIVNDDSTTISINDVTQVEGDSGLTDFVFTINATAASSKDLTVRVDTANLLEAVAGIDYVAIMNQTATIAAGATSTLVTVTVQGEGLVEIDETFTVNLTDARFNGSLDAARVTIGDDTATGTITNDDMAQLSINDVAIAEGDSGTTTFTFTVSSSAAASRAIDFTVDTATALAAIAGTDYTAVVGQSGTIAIGATSTTVTVDVIGDNLVEIDETFSVMLSDALFGGAVDLSRAALADATGTGTILNDDVASLTIDNVSMVEVDTGSTTSYSFTITSSALASEDIEVAVNTADLLDAVGGTDYTAIVGGTALISAGATSTTVTVTVIGDQLVELDETFEVRLSAGEFNGAVDTSRVVFADSVGVGTIVNDDSTTISINDIAVVEGDSGNIDLIFTISSGVAAGRDIDVQVDTANLLEAVAGVDYVAIANQDVTIVAGATSTSFAVSVIGDTVLEINETFTANLSNARFDGLVDTGRLTIADGTGVGTIANDDGLTVSINDVTQAEGNAGISNFVFTISSTAAASKDIEVTVSTANLLEALAGTDYIAVAPQTAVILAGMTSTTLTVGVTGDNLVELDETFEVNLSGAQVDGNAVLIADAQGIGTIINDDVASISIDDVSQVEADAGIVTYTFTISSNATASKDIDFTISTADLVDSTAGSDYATIVAQSGFIAAGSTSTTVSVSVVGDLIVESDETFAVNLSSPNFDGVAMPSQVVLADSQGIGTIVNNDSVTIAIDDVSLFEGLSGNTSFAFTISLDAVADKDITVTVDTSTLAEATGGTDFIDLVAQTVTITAGSTTTTLSVEVIGESDLEVDETFSVNLSDARFNGLSDGTRVTIADEIGIGTIVNDDSVALSIDNVTLLEGDAGTTNFVFTISASAMASRDIDVTVDTADLLESEAGIDYTAIVAQNATIVAGASSTTVVVAVNRELLVEIDETFTVNLSNARLDGVSAPALVSISDPIGVGTIVNDDTAFLSIGDLALSEGNVGITNFVFTVTLTAASSKDITFTVDSASLLEATAGSDYVAMSNQPVVLAAGSTSTTVTVGVVGDLLVEVDETFSLNLSNAVFDGNTDASRVQIDDAIGVGTIVNDETAQLTIDDVSVAEGATGNVTVATFTISSSAAASKDIDFTIATAGLLEAIAGVDYTAISHSAVIVAGNTSTTVTVEVLGDALVEIDETFQVDLSVARFNEVTDSTCVSILDSTGVGTILNDDSASITINDVTAIEANTGTTTGYLFTVTTDAVSSKDVTVRVDTATRLDAAGGLDFTAIAAQEFVIVAGTTSTSVVVDVIGEELVELDETFEVKLSDARFNGLASPTRVTILDDTGVGTIVNDDSTTLSIDDVAILEGDGGGRTEFVFTINSAVAAGRDISVTVDTTDLIEAIGGTDYTALVGQTVVLLAGSTSTTVSVNVNAESIVEVDETFSVTISNAQFDGTNDSASRVSITDDTGLGTIVNDDSTTLSVDDVTMVESDAGATNFVFTVTSDAAASRVIDFTVNTADLVEAVGGIDYAKIETQFERIEIGSTQTQVIVTVIGDTKVELDETFSIGISDARLGGVTNISLLTISDDTGVGTILNDDVASFSISDVRTPEGDTGTKSFVFTIATDAVASRDMQVRVDTADLLDAIAGVDYTAINGQDVIIAAGSLSTDITVDVIGDTILEINETFSVNLSNVRFAGLADATRVAIVDGVGIGIIENDDGLTIAIDDVAILEGDSGATTSFVFTISSTAVSSKDIEITINTSNFIGAVSGIDYMPIVSQTSVITAGLQSTTVTVDVIGDGLVELDETFSVDLSNAQIEGMIITIADARGIGTILNDEIASLSVDDVRVVEGDSGVANLLFTVTSDRTASEAISVTINTASLMEATAGTDYAEVVNQNVVIAAGDTSATFSVTAAGDRLVEIDETFTVDLTGAKFDGQIAPSRVVIMDATGIGTITNDDSVLLTIDDVSHVEADGGFTNYIFTITSDGLASKDLSLTVNVPDRMDLVGAPDLIEIAAQTATIAAGATSTTVTVAVRGDLVVENDEIFSVNLSDASFNGAVDTTRVNFADDTGMGTIINDDSLTISIDDVAQLEANTGFVFTIRADAVASEDLQVTVDTANLLEAQGGTDYASIVVQPAIIAAGTTATTVTVIVSNDSIVEIDETFTVNLSAALFNGAIDTSRVTISDGSGLGTIINDDTAALSIDDLALAEGDAGVTTFRFTVSTDLTASKDLGVTVDTNSLLEAIGGTDYTSIVAQPAVISAGTNSTTVTVEVIADQIVEIDETFTVDSQRLYSTAPSIPAA